MIITDNASTVLSAIIFIFATIIPTCDRIYTSTICLICSSFIYKYVYVYHLQKSNLLLLLTKLDHLCIMNLFLSYFDTLLFWQIMIVRILTIVDYRFMYFFFSYFMLNLFIEFINYECYFLAFIFTISTLTGLYSFFDYTIKGWTKYNSWLWHYACTCIILSSKLCKRNLDFTDNNLSLK